MTLWATFFWSISVLGTSTACRRRDCIFRVFGLNPERQADVQYHGSKLVPVAVAAVHRQDAGASAYTYVLPASEAEGG